VKARTKKAEVKAGTNKQKRKEKVKAGTKKAEVKTAGETSKTVF